MDPFGIITAVIGLALILSIALFIASFIRNWGNIYRIYWGFVSFLCFHLLLFCLLLFSAPNSLPAPLHAYTIGVLGVLDTLIPL